MLQNTNLKIIIVFTALIGLLAACASSNDPAPVDECRSVSYDPGIVQQELNFGNCFIEKQEDNYVIEDSTEYAAIKSAFTQSQFCESADFPVVDFSEYTLLAQWADGGGCSINFYNAVADVSESKEYLFTTTVQECGFCEMYGFSYNWVLVPKLPNDYTVRFQVKSI